METRRLTWRLAVNSLSLLACVNRCEPTSCPFASLSGKAMLVCMQMSPVSFLLTPGPDNMPRAGLWGRATAWGMGLPRQQCICYWPAMQPIPAEQGSRAVVRHPSCTDRCAVASHVLWTRRKLAGTLGRWARRAASTVGWPQVGLTTRVWQRRRREAEAGWTCAQSSPWHLGARLKHDPGYLPSLYCQLFRDLCQNMQNFQGNSRSNQTIKSSAYRYSIEMSTPVWGVLGLCLSDWVTATFGSYNVAIHLWNCPSGT